MTISPRPIVSIIAALTRQHVIGQDGRLPWHIPSDLARFKRLTMGKPIIMGRKTYESIGHPLKGRTNIVLTRSKNLEIDGATVTDSLNSALALAHANPETMIIGGSEIFKEALPITSTMYLTWIEAEIAGDTYFPKFNERDWLVVESQKCEADDFNAVPYTFCKLVRM